MKSTKNKKRHQPFPFAFTSFDLDLVVINVVAVVAGLVGVKLLQTL